MPALHLDQLRFSGARANRIRFRIWREWCFLRSAGRHLQWRLLIVIVVLIGGGLLFQRFEPEKHLTLFQACYYTWSLVFGEPPEEFPQATVLRIMFFLVPVLGLTVIIEGIVDFSFLLRDRKRYEQNWCLTMAASMTDHIVLVGFGKLGYRAFKLLRALGEPVVVIERNGQNRFLDELRREGSPLILGDARDESYLEKANVAHARSVILATNDDLANLEIALDARRLHPGVRVIVRMFDQNMADKIRDGFNIHHAMSQAAMSAPAFAMTAVDPSIVNSFVVGTQLVVMQRWQVRQGGPLAGKTVAQVMADLGCGVAELKERDDETRLFPSPDTKLKPGQQLLVQGPYETLARLAENVRQ